MLEVKQTDISSLFQCLGLVRTGQNCMETKRRQVAYVIANLWMNQSPKQVTLAAEDSSKNEQGPRCFLGRER